MKSHQQSVQDQFNPQAEAYLSSKIHQQGPDLLQAKAIIAGIDNKLQKSVDLGCGAGHLSFAVAELTEQLIAVDPSESMLDIVNQQATKRDIANIKTIHAGVEALPIESHSIDLVCSRYSAHHWTEMDKAIEEIRRILKPGGYLMIIDIQGFADPLIDTHFQTIELLRDSSHIRNRSDKEWDELFAAIGTEISIKHNWPTRIEFGSWVKRMQTAANKTEILLQLQRQASAEVKQALAIEEDGSFTAVTGLWWGQKMD